ncbi:sugar ABC transporter substrate-binding protein [Paucisalibacillus globulus]|uniref:sugar ABC transporter substrate-binding protein n=1 Tax=Paucisalibacillus globulus TaxID=351095 RepID=UPI000413A6DF|nr:substrate-binding domain-containing protein [Paucisalibacillus globulus]
MKKTTLFILAFIFIILCYFTFTSAVSVFESDWELPKPIKERESQYRLVLITQDIDTPFWNQVGKAAQEEAEKFGVSLEVWGNYGNHHEDFLKNLEIAIQSKVDGIIVQGLDSEEFKELTRVKASFYGIPIITIANDVPIEESLRRTYVGSNQYEAGQLIAKQLIADMGEKGDVVLMYNQDVEYYQEQRLTGIEDIFYLYPEIKMHHAKTSYAREDVVGATQNILNMVPETDAFIAVNANIVGAMVREIGKRYQTEPFYIYSFDDGPESIPLLEKGLLDGLVKQSPEQMGKESVAAMLKWLNGETVPLHADGYLTEIHIVKADGEK